MSCVHSAFAPVLIKRRDWGGLRPSERFKGDCIFPLYFRCGKCKHFLYSKRCGATKKEVCQSCSRAWKRYRRIQISEVVTNAEFIIWYTLTGQGQEQLPFDKSLCDISGIHKCSIQNGCKHNFEELALYNWFFKKNHNRFIEALRAKFPELNLSYLKALETQKRGVLHAHGFIVGNFPKSFDFQNFFEAASQIATGWEFGKEQDWQLLTSVNYHNKIAYLTKYITDKDLLAWTLSPETGEIKKGSYHLITKSRSWGRSMREIKQAEFERMKEVELRKSEISVLEQKLDFEGVVSLLALVLGAIPYCEAEGSTNATPLESTTKQIYRSPPI